MGQNKSGFASISEVIDKWFDNKKLAKKRRNYNAFHNWAEIVGPDIAKNTEPVKFYNDVLVIKVRNSVWTQELQYLKPELLQKIKESLPDTNIKDILFRVGRIGK